MNTSLLNRSLGSLSPRELQNNEHARLLHAIQPTQIKFDRLVTTLDDSKDEVAHNGGTNTIVIDKFEGKYLLSGGADATIAIWDLEQPAETSPPSHRPLGTIPKSEANHTYGVTHLSFYPFDSLAFLSSSYDHTVKIWSSETLQPSASFSLDAIVYSHALSPIASHLLVACAIQHPSVRLVDLRSGSSTHSLAGHNGAVLSVAWSPVEEHVLCSAGTDGTARFWDVRKSNSSLGVLDKEDSVGILGYDGHGRGARGRQRGKAHNGPVNGVVWTEDGRHVVTVGHDEKIRVWDVIRGANTLANFGPIIKNSGLSTLLPLMAPMSTTAPGKDVLFFPSEKEVLMYEVFEGRLMKRLRTPRTGQDMPNDAPAKTGRVVKNRTMALAWRAHEIELYSAHGDGMIRAWKPRTSEDAMFEEWENEEQREREDERKRKRQVLEDVYQELTKRRAFG
ncbi:WD40 repeat-like protein [Rhizodiscina lignyota]|uniref:WD40 repeat-like protein n=1 Tax=Rhizodiscina lignyota TaxID=1504668 RepID=A0A9P4M8T1_9PEZI|nr:WD40 repeat-like protein [Rhizodiscina lignyota]